MPPFVTMLVARALGPELLGPDRVGLNGCSCCPPPSAVTDSALKPLLVGVGSHATPFMLVPLAHVTRGSPTSTQSALQLAWALPALWLTAHLPGHAERPPAPELLG